MALLNLLAVVVLAGLVSASLLVCLASWGVLHAWEVRRPSWLMKRCDFCLGFHLSLIQLAAYAAIAHAPWWTIALALPTAAVCRAVARTLG
jgi:hypothetical protein